MKRFVVFDFPEKIKTKSETLKADTAERDSTTDLEEGDSDDLDKLNFLKINNDKPRNSLRIRDIDGRKSKVIC